MRALVFRCPVHGMFSVDVTEDSAPPGEWSCNTARCATMSPLVGDDAILPDAEAR